jgi:endoglucanase
MRPNGTAKYWNYRLTFFLTGFLIPFFYFACLAHATSTVSVQEITIAAPDIVAVEIRDPEFEPGEIINLYRTVAQPNGTWLRYGDKWGIVIGPKQDHLRISDRPPQTYLDRGKIDDVKAYGPIGGHRVIAVYRKSVPYDSGIYMSDDGATRTGASFKHYIYLKLDGKLQEGQYLIDWPDSIIPPSAFNYSYLQTRAIALRASQLGYTPDDTAKTAYLTLWLPGGPDQGAFDFRPYGFDHFTIIDQSGAQVFTSAISLRKGPKDLEPGNGVREPLLEYSQASATALPVAAITDATPPLVTVTSHGFDDGQRILLERLQGEQDATGVFATVRKISDDTFEVIDATGPIGGAYAGGGTVRPAYTANRAGTYVFELDYSAWKPKSEGIYRLVIPGLGVSDPFPVKQDLWFDAARVSIGGLYNHRSGIPLDGRFGYTRPAAFRPGPDMKILESRLPLAWSSEGPGSFVPFAAGVSPEWLTDKEAPQSYWGGYMDAGDWDRRIQHVEISALLLDIFEWMPEEFRSRPLGVPQSSEVLDDPIYRKTGPLPDLINEALWPLDFYRRLQTEDGSIRGGIESASNPMLGEPSFLEHQAVFVYAPDHISTYKYAAIAAKMARILRDIGKSELADLFEKSALSAWTAAERGYRDPDSYYADALAAAQTTDVFSSIPWETRRAALQKTAAEYRAAAAASLFRLSGSPEYEEIFRLAWLDKLEIYAHTADGAWDYLHSSGGDPSIKDRIKARFIGEASWIADEQDKLAYPSMKHPGAPAGWGQGTAPDYNMVQLFMRGHQLSGNAKILRIMQLTSQGILGANQVGLSFTTGIGERQIRHPLQEDHRAMGVPSPSGITIYGFGPQAGTAQGWIFGPPWSPLAEVGTAENAQNRTIYPSRFSLPYQEYLIEHPAVIMQQEYTVQQPIATTAALWFYLAIALKQTAAQ